MPSVSSPFFVLAPFATLSFFRGHRCRPENKQSVTIYLLLGFPLPCVPEACFTLLGYVRAHSSTRSDHRQAEVSHILRTTFDSSWGLFSDPMSIILRLDHACVAYLTKTLDLMTLCGRFCNRASRTSGYRCTGVHILQKFRAGIKMMHPCPGYCGTFVEILQKFRVRV